MAYDNFNGLQALVRKYIERGGPSDPEVFEALPDLINIAERNIAKDLNVTGVRRTVTSTFIAGQAVIKKPSDWRRTIEINFGTGADFKDRTWLLPRSVGFLNAYWPDREIMAQPLYYGDYNDEYYLISPTPSFAYPFELVYAASPSPLSATNQTNYLTQKFPNLLLYGTLRECEPFMKNDQRIATWQGMYAQHLGTVSEEDLKKIVDRTSTRQEP